MTRLPTWLGVVALSWLCASTALAHPLSFGVLVVRESRDGRVDVSYRFSGTEARIEGAEPELPRRCRAVGAPSRHPLVEGGIVEQSRFDCGEEGLSGATVAIRGMEGTGVQVLVRVERADGTTQRTLLDDGSRTLDLSGADPQPVVLRYLVLGVQHIAGGVDHLAFVLGLVLLVRVRRRIVLTVTAFTLGHSVTLALGALSFVDVPAAPVEAMIAASILLLAVELATPRPESWTRRAPGAVAALFGLLHGLGFAGALSETGLPSDAVLPALLGFNLGVELGQIAFILTIGVVGSALSAWPPTRRRLPQVESSLVLVLGGAASFFLLNRAFSLGTL